MLKEELVNEINNLRQKLEREKGLVRSRQAYVEKIEKKLEVVETRERTLIVNLLAQQFQTKIIETRNGEKFERIVYPNLDEIHSYHSYN